MLATARREKVKSVAAGRREKKQRNHGGEEGIFTAAVALVLTTSIAYNLLVSHFILWFILLIGP